MDGDEFDGDSDNGDYQVDDLSDESGIINNRDVPSDDRGWIKWFSSLEGHEFIVEVDEEYIRDPFNLYGLKSQLPNVSTDKFKDLLKMILQPAAPNEEDLADDQFLEQN